MDVFEKPYEAENQVILRLPPKRAEKLKEILQAGNLKDRLSIQLEEHGQSGKLTLDGEPLTISVKDLPTLIETHKTLDMKTFYKTADIGQILICEETEADANEEHSSATSQAKDKPQQKDKKSNQFPHGISAPLKNVRQRRFRKTARKKHGDNPEVRKEVIRLLKQDSDAFSSTFEIVFEDVDCKEETVQTQNEQTDNLEKPQVVVNAQLLKVFEECSSSDSEDGTKSEDEDDAADEEKNVEWRKYTNDELPTDVAVLTDPEEIAKIELQLETMSGQLCNLEQRKNRKGNLLANGNILNKMLLERFQIEFEDTLRHYKQYRQEYLRYLVMLGRASPK